MTVDGMMGLQKGCYDEGDGKQQFDGDGAMVVVESWVLGVLDEGRG